jgi:S-adenosylmethionine synthetase
MIRTAEAVLDGHPDRFCDLLADAVIREGYNVDPECYGQVEVSVWSDVIFFSGAVATRNPLKKTIEEIVIETGTAVGYTPNNHIDANRYKIVSELCLLNQDPNDFTRVVNDQSIVIGWAGYDSLTEYLPPEQFLVREFRNALIDDIGSGLLNNHGPDGKLLIVMREDSNGFTLETIVVTIQHKSNTNLLSLAADVGSVLKTRYEALASRDPRWRAKWKDVRVLGNPNGNLIAAGSDGDNGQTGRKLVMTFYGPRVPIGGGAIHGKDLAHIDRLAAYATRQAAVEAVKSGAKECQITAVYSPGCDEPLEILVDLVGRGTRPDRERFDYRRMRSEFSVPTNFFGELIR